MALKYERKDDSITIFKSGVSLEEVRQIAKKEFPEKWPGEIYVTFVDTKTSVINGADMIMSTKSCGYKDIFVDGDRKTLHLINYQEFTLDEIFKKANQLHESDEKVKLEFSVQEPVAFAKLVCE